MNERPHESLVKQFEVRERRRARVTGISVGVGFLLTAVLLSLSWRSTRETAAKQSQIDTLSTRFTNVTAVKDSLAKVLVLRDSSLAIANSGAALAMNGQINDAHAQYRAAIEVDSTNWAAWELEGTLYRRTNPSKAIPPLRRSILLNPSNAWTFYNLSIALWNLGEHEAAIDSLKRAVELAPDLRATIRRDAQFNEFRSSVRFQALVNP